MFEYNKNQARRDELLKIEKPYSGGVANFKNLELETLRILIQEGFVDLDEQQNEAPKISEIYGFMVDHPIFTAHGYAVTSERGDYRISIEGLNARNLSPSDIYDFTAMFCDANEFSVGENFARCWYD